MLDLWKANFWGFRQAGLDVGCNGVGVGFFGLTYKHSAEFVPPTPGMPKKKKKKKIFGM